MLFNGSSLSSVAVCLISAVKIKEKTLHTCGNDITGEWWSQTPAPSPPIPDSAPTPTHIPNFHPHLQLQLLPTNPSLTSSPHSYPTHQSVPSPHTYPILHSGPPIPPIFTLVPPIPPIPTPPTCYAEVHNLVPPEITQGEKV